PHTVTLDGKKMTAKYIVVAVGGWPVMPEFPGSEYAITSNEAFYLPSLPKRVIIVGGGYIGVEFAGIFHGLGTRVTQVHRDYVFLRGFDEDVRAFLAQEMTKKGVRLRFKTQVTRIERINGANLVRLTDGTSMETETVMFATGRAPNTRILGLENAGVQLNGAGAVVVDDYSRTTAPNIYAVGDCTDRMKLTPVALAEGRAVAETLFNSRPTKPNYANVPTAVFSDPNVATVGLTEGEARTQHGAIDVYRTTFKPLKHTLTGSDEQTLMKLVVDRATDRVLGCHMVGADAAEIVQGLAIALNCGATKAQFDATIGIHPTAAEEFVTMREKVTPA
ncbi:MAG: FAD-dependent oxidoreductase, partial [Candidatus Binatia bacterium]